MNRPAQEGYVLVTGLIFVLILAVIGINAMQMTNVDYRMSSNTAFKKQAFERAESGRSAIGSVLAEHLAQAGTWSTVTTPSGLTIEDKNADGFSSDGVGDNLALNGNAETYDNPTKDASYAVDLTGTDKDFDVDMSVFNLKTVLAPGSGAGQFSGTLGLGKGAGAGGTHVFLQIRSQGSAPSQARSDIIVDFRHVNK